MNNKQLLLKDLCARLPYKVICSIYRIDGLNEELSGYFYDGTSYEFYFGKHPVSVDNISEIKPYLRPMSSMTEEEKEELRQEQIKDEQLFADCIKNHPEMRGLIIPHFAADWCDKNMFDYRGLIPKGLAIKAPEGMYD